MGGRGGGWQVDAADAALHPAHAAAIAAAAAHPAAAHPAAAHPASAHPAAAHPATAAAATAAHTTAAGSAVAGGVLPGEVAEVGARRRASISGGTKTSGRRFLARLVDRVAGLAQVRL